jgi:hypothetical protein
MGTDTFCIILIGVGLFVDAIAIFFQSCEGRNLRRGSESSGYFEDEQSEDALADRTRVDALVAKAAARAGDWRIAGWCGLGVAALGVFIGVAMRA